MCRSKRCGNGNDLSVCICKTQLNKCKRFCFLESKRVRHFKKEHFGIKKVIFGEAGINHVIVDIEGKYGMTQRAMGIIIIDKKEGENIKKALLSDKFNSILKSCMWGNFRIDWRLFTYFKITNEICVYVFYSRESYGGFTYIL